MTLKTMLTRCALVAAVACAGPAFAAPIKATVVYANKTVVIDTDTSYPVKTFRTQVEQATGIPAKYLYLQVLSPKPAVLSEGDKTPESYGLYADFRVLARQQATPNP